MFCRSLVVLFTFSFGHCGVCSSSIYGFWLPLRYLQTLRWTPFVFYRKKRDCQFACSSVTNRRHMSYYLISTFIGWMLFDVTYYHFSYISAIVFNHIGIMMIPPKLCNYLVCFLKKGTKNSQLYICIPCGNMYMSFGRCIVCHSIYCFWLPLWAS